MILRNCHQMDEICDGFFELLQVCKIEIDLLDLNVRLALSKGALFPHIR